MQQQPMTGESLAVGLVNTRRRRGTGTVDLLANAAGLASWLAATHQADVDDAEAVRLAAMVARDAICAAIDRAPDADAGLNAVLARGVIVRAVRGGAVTDRVLFADEAWAPAWRAVADYVQLTSQTPDSIRRCASPDCILCFHDPQGRRRWCSMSGCGNRAKARRHHARSQGAAATPTAPATALPPEPRGR